MNSIAYFEIQASNPAQLVAFYTTVFQWQFEKQEGLPIEYYRTTDMSGAGMLGAILQRPAAVPALEQGTNAYVCSIKVENYDSTAKIILDNGGIVALPKFAVPGRCWQGYSIDPDHNTFGIFEVDEQAA